jgi:hypothetical protein
MVNLTTLHQLPTLHEVDWEDERELSTGKDVEINGRRQF